MIFQRSGIIFPPHLPEYDQRRAGGLDHLLRAAASRRKFIDLGWTPVLFRDGTLGTRGSPTQRTREHYYAFVEDYLEFDRSVPFKVRERQFYYERLLQKADGSTNKGWFGRSVRPLEDAEYYQILAAGFASIIERRYQPLAGRDEGVPAYVIAAREPTEAEKGIVRSFQGFRTDNFGTAHSHRH